jgi:hypothetical protein
VRIIEEPYFTPDGTLDFPFAYVYDSSANSDGQNILNISQQFQGDSDFILRRIMGVPTVVDTPANGGRFNFKNASGNYANGNPTTGIIVPNTWPVVPEKKYRTNEQISFDLYRTLRAFNVCSATPIYASQIAFMGVKRFAKGSGYPRQVTPYKYREVRYAYAFELTINWAHFDNLGNVQPAQRFIQQMDNFDFELLRISISQPGANVDGVPTALTTPDFAITLYDPNMHQFSSAPLLQGFLNAGRPTPATSSPYQATFPCPSQIYPAGSAITFDITSLLCGPSLPQSYEILFDGIWRYPC